MAQSKASKIVYKCHQEMKFVLVGLRNTLQLFVNQKQACSKHRMTGGGGRGAEQVAHINFTARFGPSVEAYFLVHVRSLHLSTIPFVLISNFPFVLTLTK